MEYSLVHRCSICNKVDNQGIATEVDDYNKSVHFEPDPKNKSQFLCSDCADEIREVAWYWEIRDEGMK